MRSLTFRCLFLILFLGHWVIQIECSAPETRNRRILAVVDPKDSKKFSVLITSLEEKGFDVDVPSDMSKVSLRMDGKWAYGGILFLSPTQSSLGGDMSQHKVLNFIDDGGSAFVALDSEYEKPWSQLVSAMGIIVDKRGRFAVDHGSVSTEQDDGSHTWIFSGGMTSSRRIAGLTKGPVVFHGIGASLDPDNELVESVLWGSPSSYSAPGDETAPLSTGTKVVLAAALETRKGGRGAYIGSTTTLSDSILEKNKATKEFVSSLVLWTFGHRGILRVNELRHVRKSDRVSSDTYRIKDVLEFSLDVSEWDGEMASWVPYSADDIQLEFTNLDPYQRSRMQDLGNGTFQSDVVVPDRIGMYKFVVEYIRPGLSHISVSEGVGIRPFAHNEYERFIIQAFPYYTAVFSMLSGVLALGFLLLYGRRESE